MPVALDQFSVQPVHQRPSKLLAANQPVALVTGRRCRLPQLPFAAWPSVQPNAVGPFPQWFQPSGHPFPYAATPRLSELVAWLAVDQEAAAQP